MLFLVSALCRVELLDDTYLMNWKGYGRNMSSPAFTFKGTVFSRLPGGIEENHEADIS